MEPIGNSSQQHPVSPKPGGFFSRIPAQNDKSQSQPAEPKASSSPQQSDQKGSPQSPQQSSQQGGQKSYNTSSQHPRPLRQGGNKSKPALESIPVNNSAEFVIPQPKTIIPPEERTNHQHKNHNARHNDGANGGAQQQSGPERPMQGLSQQPMQSLPQQVLQNSPISGQAPTHSHQHRSRRRPLDREKMELAMTEAMKVLKRDIGPLLKKKKTPKKKIIQERNKQREQRIPTSLNDILVNLAKLDNNIEASALVDVDGSLLAAAVSRRISEYLISTIANTLGNIGTDIINSLDSGDLEFATLHGTDGILFLAPIMKNIFLMLLTGPDAKIGVINIAKMRVKKQLELFFAKRNLKKTPV